MHLDSDSLRLPLDKTTAAALPKKEGSGAMTSLLKKEPAIDI